MSGGSGFDYALCTKCNHFGFPRTHRCPPVWDVYSPDDGGADGARKVHALDAEEACMRWAERDDAESAEYSIASGNPVVVMVRRSGSHDSWVRYRVEGEWVPSYGAQEDPAP